MSQGYCTSCGAALMQGSAFCAACGAPAAGTAPEPTPNQHQPAAPPPQMPPAAPPAMMPAQAPPAYAPPPAPAGYAPPQAAKQSSVLRWVIIVIGVGMVILGVARMTNGLGTITGGSRGPAPTAADRAEADRAISQAILVGTWAPSDSPACTIWLRFQANGTLSDNAGNSGTWSYAPRGGSSGTLTMTINNMPPRSGDLTMSGNDQFALGGQSWRRTNC